MEKQLFKFALQMIQFPFAQVCKHHVALEVLNILEQQGVAISNDLAKSVVNADDETAERILIELISK